MTGFIADETFSFEIKKDAILRFTIEKKIEDSSIRGMMFIETDIDNNLDVRMYQNGTLLQRLNQGRMGILFSNL